LQLPPAWYLIATPDCQVSTAEVFQAPELTRDSAPIKIRDFLGGSQVNDCLPVVKKRYPEVARALEILGQFGSARLTGTGACVFVEFGTESEARRALAEMPAELPGFVAQGMDRSPLIDSEPPNGSG
jgi:4-diphosphocytidyl-2-C-methyl-D-erythritol kinase